MKNVPSIIVFQTDGVIVVPVIDTTVFVKLLLLLVADVLVLL